MTIKNLVPLIDEEAIQRRILEMAEEINAVYKDEPLVVVCVLKGAFMFFSDLVRHLTCRPEIDFVRLASYGSGSEGGQTISFTKDVEIPLKDKHVLIVEDIVDTGESIEHMIKELEARNPASVEVCTLFFKPGSYRKTLPIKYRAMEIGNEFIVGYGLDYDQLGRSLKDIYVVTE